MPKQPLRNLNNAVMQHIISKVPVRNRIRLATTSRTMRNTIRRVRGLPNGPIVVNTHPEKIPSPPEAHVRQAAQRLEFFKDIVQNQSETLLKKIALPYNRLFIRESLNSLARKYGIQNVEIRTSYERGLKTLIVETPFVPDFPYLFDLELTQQNGTQPRTVDINVCILSTGFRVYLMGDDSSSIRYFNAKARPFAPFEHPLTYRIHGYRPILSKDLFMRMAESAKMLRTLARRQFHQYSAIRVTIKKTEHKPAFKAFMKRARIQVLD